MNFKKYHVSKNLFDGSIEQGSLNESSAIGTDYNNSKTAPTAVINPYRVRIANPIYIDRELTLSIDFNNYQMYVLFYDENQQYTGEHSSSWRNGSLTLSGEYIGKYIGLAVKSKQGGNVPISPSDNIKLMLNTGSSLLPYEPYSSEVWHDIPYYIHKTATGTLTLPAVIYPNDTSITVGLKGQSSQTGTPTPDNPVDVVGCGTRTGNLFVSNWEQGAIDSSGMDTPFANGVRTKNYIPVTPNTIYSILRNITTSYINLRFYNSNKQYINYGTSSTIRLISGSSEGNPMYAGMGFCCFEIIDTNIKYMRINDNSNDTSTKYMMVEGQYTASTMPSYEPWGYKIPISSANTTTPVYLGEVETTRKIKKLVLDGTEDWSLIDTDVVYLTPTVTMAKQLMAICSHYTFLNVPRSELTLNSFTTNGGSGTSLWIKTQYTSTADFKTFLQQEYANGTPVTIWYVLATEETDIINEPLMKIGTYADSLTTSIPCTAGENTLDAQTTVAPSEVTANYQGWHPVQNVHESENGQWD